MNNNIRNFKEDLDNSNNPKLRKSWENLIKLKYGDNTQILWKDSQEIQRGMGTDTVIRLSDGRRFSIELKTRAYSSLNNPGWIMEIVSHVYDKEDEETRKHLYSKEGWVYSTMAEYIFHGVLNKDGTEIIKAIFYNLAPFKSQLYKSEFDQYKNSWWATKYGNGNFQLTLNKLIPKEIIKRDANEFWEWEDESP